MIDPDLIPCDDALNRLKIFLASVKRGKGARAEMLTWGDKSPGNLESAPHKPCFGLFD